MPPYQERFPVGTRVRIANRAALESFIAAWHLHNPLHPDQLAFAGTTTLVRSVGFYHGGDLLYELDHVAGIWHEELLLEFSDRAT